MITGEQTQTAANGDSPEHLVCLVGGNPLPLYLTARTLKPRKVWLVHTPDTATVAERLKSQIEMDCPGTQCEASGDLVKVKDAYSAEQVRRVISGIKDRTGGFWLDYTGGTEEDF